MAHRVAAAAVQVQVGGRILMRFRGEPLGEGVDAEVAERLVRKGLVVEVADPVDEEAEKAAADKAAEVAATDAEQKAAEEKAAADKAAASKK